MENTFVSPHPLVAHKLARLRDERTDPKKFRELIREIAGLMAYEATRDLATASIRVRTPLEETEGSNLAEKIGLVPILRAGLGMVEGGWELMPTAEVWHIGLYRDEHTFRPVEYYNKLPIEPTVSVCLILDPMLATGGSAVATVGILKRWGVSQSGSRGRARMRSAWAMASGVFPSTCSRSTFTAPASKSSGRSASTFSSSCLVRSRSPINSRALASRASRPG